MDYGIGLPPRYKFECLIAQTPRSLVYLVRRSDGTNVALKEIDLSLCRPNPHGLVESIQSFAKRLHHRHLVTCHDCIINTTTNYTYVELDYCPGGSLADLLRRQRRLDQRVSIPQVWVIAAHLLSALSYLHFFYKDGGEINCVTHGHITPESILFGPSGITYLNIFSTEWITGQCSRDAETGPSLAEKCKKDVYDLGALFTKMLGITPEEIGTCTVLQNEPSMRCFLSACCGTSGVDCRSAAELLLFDDIQAVLKAKSYSSSSHISSVSSRISGNMVLHSSSLSNSNQNQPLFDRLYPQNYRSGVDSALDRGSSPKENSSDTDLISAVLRNDARAVNHHINQVGKRNAIGCTALMFAAAKGYTEFIVLLAEELCMQDTNGWTALMVAAQQGNTECVRLLAAKESCLSDMNGFTALMAAAVNGRVDCVGLLVDHEKGLKYVDGRTALMWAAFVGSLDCVKLLAPFEWGEKDNMGNNALAWAWRGGDQRVCTYLQEISTQIMVVSQ